MCNEPCDFGAQISLKSTVIEASKDISSLLFSKAVDALVNIANVNM